MVGVLVLLGAWGALLSMLQWQHEETLKGEMRHATNTATALKEHTLRILDAVDQAATRIQHRAAQGTLTPESLVRIADETGMAPHILTQLSFVDANGIFQGSNLDPDGSRSKHPHLMQREHIRVHLRPQSTPRQPMKNGLFISAPLVGKVSGVRTIQLTRKITDAGGQTLGVVVASLNQRHFIDVYRGVDFGSDGGVLLVGLDGIIRARVLDREARDIDQPLSQDMLAAIRRQPVGALQALSADGLERIVGFSRVGDYDLAVLCGPSSAQALASWSAMRDTVLQFTLVLSAAVVLFVLAFILSIRRLTRSHDALTRSEAKANMANQAKSEFLAAMSHELRTPLTSIRGFAELMELRSKDPLVREQSAHIRQGAEHLGTLLNEVLDLAKIEAGAMQAHTEAVRPHAVAHEVADLFRVSALAKALSLTVTIDPATPAMLQTDRLKLKQVLSNLLSNAIKFTATGAVALSVAPSDEGGHVLFKVSDTGPGIDPAQHALIFEKFRQADARVSYQHGGTGLGLALSRELAGLLGGTISVESALGKGATFTFAVPWDHALHPAPQAATTAAA